MSTDSRAQGDLSFTASPERLEEFRIALTESASFGLDTSNLPHEFNFGLTVAGFKAVKETNMGYFFFDREASEGTHLLEIDEGKNDALYYMLRDTEKIVEIAKSEGATVNGQIVRWDENNNTEMIRVKDNVITHRKGVLVAKFDDIEVVID